jgi:hypothetical protein
MICRKPVLVGEMNPYGADPDYALYPAPDGCSGHRLCCLILGMQRRHYLDSFDRVNLCDGKWSIKAARIKATELWASGRRFILLGSKVCYAWGIPFTPFIFSDNGNCVVLPHPSGLCRLWNEVGVIAKAREVVSQIAPELAGKIAK